MSTKSKDQKTSEPYKILWYSLPNLIDTSNGAAISNKHILECLEAQGFRIAVLTATCYDDDSGALEFAKIEQAMGEPAQGFYQFKLNNIDYFVAKTASKRLKEIKADEQTTVWSLFVKLLEDFQPDLMMGFCPDLFSLSLRREAKARGIATVYTVCNASHDNFSFPDCDAVLTNSLAISAYYNRRQDRHVKVKPFGIVIDPNKVLAPQDPRNRRYVSLINPTPYKGIAIFIGLMRAFFIKYPNNPLRFLIVKSRGDYESIMKQLHFADGTKLTDHPDFKALISRLDVAEHTTNIKQVYALSYAVTCPSLCFEAWGMVATEANMSGVPVIAHNLGGLPEAIGRQYIDKGNNNYLVDDSALGGVLVEPPKSTMDDNTCIPTDEELAPYLAALEMVLTHDYSKQCHKSAQVNAPERNLERLKNYIMPLMKRSRKHKTPYSNSFFLSESYESEKRERLKAQKAALQTDS